MAKGTRGGRRTGIGVSAPTPQPVIQNVATIDGVVKMDDNYASQLRQSMDDYYNPDVVSAIKIYTSKRTDANGYAPSQNLNYALDNDLPLDANSKHMDRYLEQGMHPIGITTELTRACHDDVLKSLGINDYSKLTEQQLTKKLVGGTVKSKAYMSFGYDDNRNPFLTGSNSGGREIIWKLKTKPSMPIVFGAKSQAEVIANKGITYKFNKVYYTGGYATPRNSGRKPVLVIEAEVV